MSPHAERERLKRGFGVTNAVRRATTSTAELSGRELALGGQQLAAKVQRLRPRAVAVLGIDAYRAAFGRKRVAVGPQPAPIGTIPVQVLSNPSGLNAGYWLPALVRPFRRLRRASKQKTRLPPAGLLFAARGSGYSEANLLSTL